MATKDPAKRAAHNRTYYERNRAAFKARAAADLERNKAYVLAAKVGRPCLDCGMQYPPYVLDFDHRPGANKVDDVSNLVRRRVSIATLRAEIDKCDLVCANCHRIRTWQRLEECATVDDVAGSPEG